MFLSIHSSKDISNVDNTFSLEKQHSFRRKRFLILFKTFPKQPKEYSKAILKQKLLWKLKDAEARVAETVNIVSAGVGPGDHLHGFPPIGSPEGTARYPNSLFENSDLIKIKL